MSAFVRRLRRHAAFRYPGYALMMAAAVLAAAIVSTLTIDLGPVVRGYAEREGSKRLKRPIHIGRLSMHVLSGRFLLEDFSIDGLQPTDRLFFSAKHLALSLDWTSLLQKDVTIDSVQMTDWQMLVERWDDRQNFPKFTSDEDEPNKPKVVTTTLKWFHASRGRFTFEDHAVPWSVVAPNLDITITNLPTYHGEAVFKSGVVKIQDDEPMWANMHAWFKLDGGRIHLDRIDLDTDGAKTVATGDVDLGHWPEQTYQVKSRVNFSRMRELFFARETWRIAGDADFQGLFHLFKDGHDLHGSFASDLAEVDQFRFPSLFGSLRWTRSAFEVSDAGAEFFGGDARFGYSIKPLGSPSPPTHRFDWRYSGVDLAAISDFARWPGLRLAGTASGENLLEWPGGRVAEGRRDEGHSTIEPPPGVTPMTASLAVPREADVEHARHEWGPFAPGPLPSHLPIAGEVTYRFDPERIEVDPSHLASERTHVAFQGTTDWGERSRFSFHATSRDWQESDQLLAGILTDFGSPTNPVAFGGFGEFDGTMTGPFRQPRVEGDFTGEDLRAWDTLWGSGRAHIVIGNSYVEVSGGDIRQEGSEIHADGRFSLGFPRSDGGDEIDARFRVVRRDLESLRHAFGIDEYPVTGRMSGEFHLTGEYRRPLGFGGMTIDQGTAWSEPFDKASASLRLDGTGVRLDGVSIDKSGGMVTGAAFVGWDGTYSFNADGQRLQIEDLKGLNFSSAPPLSGLAGFSATGNGTFDDPRYEVRFRASGVFIGEEGIGQLTGMVTLRGKELAGEVAATSPRLAITGAGRIALTPQADAEMTFRFHDSSLDPYVRLFVPRLSPFTTAVASGTIRVVGELAEPEHLLVDGMIDSVDMRLFDYALTNAMPVHLALDRRVVKVEDLQLAGEGTRLSVAGSIGLNDQQIAFRASGDANLGILQGFFRDVRGSGRAELTAAINGPLRAPVFSGSASIADGRIRLFSLPNSLEDINGTLNFDGRGIRLDGLTATLGEGRVQFGGLVGFEGYVPGELNVTAVGQDMHLRYPEGVRSTVDADLVLLGTFKAPTLGGTVTVKNGVWNRQFDSPGSFFGFSGRPAAASAPVPVPAAAPASALRLDLRILVPSSLRVSNNLIQQMVASADLQLRGTYDRPVLLGHAEVDRGEFTFVGRRYKVTRGVIDFTNPSRIDPFFDVEAETSVRVPYQTYRVTVHVAGTTDRLQPTFDSDPPLPSAADVLALLFSDTRRLDQRDAELRALQNPNQRQTDILTTTATQALANPLSAGMGRVVEQAFGVDTFQVSPSLIDPTSQQVNPSARLTIGKRISDRAYLTFSRSLNSPVNDQIILLEYDATDRLSWILSRNENQTYALEFRVRHVF